jgi:hypothetical protein
MMWAVRKCKEDTVCYGSIMEAGDDSSLKKARHLNYRYFLPRYTGCKEGRESDVRHGK